MAEDIKVINVPIRPGMRQDLDSVDAPPGSIAEAKNVRFPVARGACVPRPGTIAIPSTTVNNAARISNSTESIGALFSIGDAPALAVGGQVFAFDEDAQKFDLQGSYSTALPVRRRTVFGGHGDLYGDQRFGVAVSTGGHVCYVGGRLIGQKTSVAVETADGVLQIITEIDVAGARVVACGADFVVVGNLSTALNAYVLSYATGVWTLSGPTSVGTLNSTSDRWDICPESSGAFYVYHQSAAAVATLHKVSYPALTSTTVTHAVTGQASYSVYSDGTNVWCGLKDDPSGARNIIVRVYTAAATPVFVDDVTLATGVAANDTPLIGPARDGSTSGAAFACYRVTNGGSATSQGMVLHDLALAASVVSSSASQTTWHLTPFSKPDRGGRVWCMTASIADTEWTAAAPTGVRFHRTILCRWTNLARAEAPRIELSCLELEGIPVVQSTSFSAPASGDSGSSFMLIPERRAGAQFLDAQLALYEYTLSDRDSLRSVATIARAAVVAGQPIQLWSRGAAQTGTANTVQTSGVTSGYAQRPVITAVAMNSAAGSLSTNSVYSWVALYEWVDLGGNVHRSAPSAPYTANTGTNTQASFTVRGCPADQRCGDNLTLAPPVIHLFRTRADEEQLRRETTVATVASANQEAGTITSNTADANLRDFLYTEGGQVEFSLAPACRFVRPAETAVWFGGMWDPRLVQKSRDFFPGEPVQASDLDSWKVYLPDDLVGMAYQDGLAYCLCKNGIYVVSGDGPNEQGVGVFAPPRAITTEFGAIETTSILETSAGVFFRSPRGFMIIPRGGGQPVFVGAGVQFDIRAGVFDECLGAAAVTGETRTARFLMRSTAGDDIVTRVYIYDLDSQAWSYDDLGTELVACGNWPDGFCVGLNDVATNAAYLETDAEFADGSGASAITGFVKLHGIRPFGVAGWGRCQSTIAVMQEPAADAAGATVTLAVSTDRIATWTGSWTVTSAGNGATLYRSVDIKHQQCSEIMVEWTSARASNAAALGPELNAIVLAVTPEKGTRPLEQSNR